MSSRKPNKGNLLAILMVFSVLNLQAQDKLSWLDDYSGAIQIANDSYQYNFANVDGDDCKLKFEELHTNKKGSTATRSWIFYLSDMDPSALNFKAKGKSINLLMETQRSQKFISYYEEGELEGYTEKITLIMNEVEMARSFIEILKEKIANCKETQLVWDHPRQALNWLIDNVGNASDDGTEWEQQFKSGSRDYIVEFQTNSVNSKGEVKSTRSIFDLSDINPQAINLKISGKSLMVEVAVKESKRFIEVISPAGSLFTSKLLIYTNEIEVAREVVNALYFLVSNTTPERPGWDSYSSSLGFIKDKLGDAAIGDDLYSYELNYDSSPSGLVQMVTRKSESGGSAESLEYTFYMAHMMNKAKIEVSKRSVTLEIYTKDNLEFIREMNDGKVSDYTSKLNIYISNLDLARDILNAFEFAVDTSEQNIIEFTGISELGTWFSDNVGQVEIGTDAYEQQISILTEYGNQLTAKSKVIDSDGKSTEYSHILYPEDIGLDKLEIKVSGKKLYVLLQTDKGKYVKLFENGKLQNFVSSTEVLFIDPLVAKNFISAIRFLKENSGVEDSSVMQKEEAMTFLIENIQTIELSDKQYEQKMEVTDEESCKVSFQRVETDSKGGSREYRYEFNLSDIHSKNSKFTIKGAGVLINLITQGGEKLIKPYKDGEAGDFVDDFIIYTDDVQLAKQILAAFAALSETCK